MSNKNPFWNDVPDFSAQAEPTDLVIGTSKERVLVIVKPTGEVVFGPDYQPTEAATVFWEAIGRRRAEVEDRQLLVNHMEAILTRLGAQDLRTEDLRARAASEMDPNKSASLLAAAESSMAKLSMIAHQAIELGRALVNRPSVPVPVVPVEVPQSVQQNERSAYTGREGLPTIPEDLNPGGVTFIDPSTPKKQLN